MRDDKLYMPLSEWLFILIFIAALRDQLIFRYMICCCVAQYFYILFVTPCYFYILFVTAPAQLFAPVRYVKTMKQSKLKVNTDLM